MNDLQGGPDGYNHFGRHGFRGHDRLPIDSLIDGDNVAGDILVAQGTPPTFQRLATGAAGTVFIGGSTFSANLALTGWVRVGSATTPANTTAGDLTAVRINIGNASFTSGVEMQVTGDAVFSGYSRVGSVSAPTNTTAGDFTCIRVLAGDATLASGVVAAFAGNQTTTGWLNVGAATAPSNTTAGDLTAKRAHIGTDGAFTSGKEFEVTGDALVSADLQVGGEFDHNGTLFSVFNHAAGGQATGGENVTNNVTNSGSTNGTIPDIATGAYATDYTNLRNALYQLARMLKQDHDALRAWGFLT